jgi:uncharacterized membrane protein YeaQ/YmgE (transglycosylase-associated protein family)
MQEVFWVAAIGLTIALLGRGFFRAQDRMKMVHTATFGIFGAAAMAFLGNVFGFFAVGSNHSYIAAAVGAAVMLYAYGLWARRAAPAPDQR